MQTGVAGLAPGDTVTPLQAGGCDGHGATEFRSSSESALIHWTVLVDPALFVAFPFTGFFKPVSIGFSVCLKGHIRLFLSTFHLTNFFQTFSFFF